MSVDEDHPAMIAARNSWAAVMANDKQAWLDLMAENICVEDPIGESLTNPTGKGVQGKAAMAEFYDKHIANSKIIVEAHESYLPSSNNESAHVMTLHTTLSNGVKTHVRGIFTYRIDDEGKLTNLRGFWNLGVMQFEQPG